MNFAKYAFAALLSTLTGALYSLKTDLIVMGAYGHTRSKAHTLDGTTSGLLAAITVPILLSH